MQENEYGAFRDLVRAKSGIELPPIRRNEVERIIEQTLAEAGLDHPRELLRRLASPEGKKELEEFVGALTIGETYFFRNRPQIEALQNQILPGLIERRREAKSLRVWSAGCASGEEPYSIAILLERLLPDIEDWRIQILGTDVNRSALKKAVGGTYGQWSFRNVPPHIKRTYFSEKGKALEIVGRIRDRVTFGYLNLVEDPYPALATNTYSLDVILCRNVLIYFNEETRERIIEGFYEALVDGGWLIVGHAEPSQDLFYRFEAHNVPGATLYRKKEVVAYLPARPKPPPAPIAAPRPEMPLLPPTEATEPAVPKEPVGADPAEPTPHQAALDLWTAGRYDDAMQALAAIADGDASDARAPYLAAKLAADRRDLDAAKLWIGVALTRDPLFAPGHYLRSLILEEEGDHQGALKCARSCLYADATWPLGHFALGVLFQRLGKTARAAKAFEHTLRVLGDRPDDQVIPDADGVTTGQLRHLAESHHDLVSHGSDDLREGRAVDG